MFGSSLPHVVVGWLMSYLCYLCLFAHSGVQHTYCVVFLFCLFCLVFCLVYPMLSVSLDCSFLIAASVFSYVYFIMYIDILVLKLMQGQLPTETTGARGTDLQPPPLFF